MKDAGDNWPLIFESAASLLWPTSTIKNRGDDWVKPFQPIGQHHKLLPIIIILLTARKASNCSMVQMLFDRSESASSTLL